jgi:hypothetical protein
VLPPTAEHRLSVGGMMFIPRFMTVAMDDYTGGLLTIEKERDQNDKINKFLSVQFSLQT